MLVKIIYGGGYGIFYSAAWNDKYFILHNKLNFYFCQIAVVSRAGVSTHVRSMPSFLALLLSKVAWHIFLSDYLSLSFSLSYYLSISLWTSVSIYIRIVYIIFTFLFSIFYLILSKTISHYLLSHLIFLFLFSLIPIYLSLILSLIISLYLSIPYLSLTYNFFLRMVEERRKIQYSDIGNRLLYHGCSKFLLDYSFIYLDMRKAWKVNYILFFLIYHFYVAQFAHHNKCSF